MIPKELITTDTFPKLAQYWNENAQSQERVFAKTVLLDDYKPFADGVTDDAFAFINAVADCPEDGVILVSGNAYAIKQTVEITKRIHIRGLETIINITEDLSVFKFLNKDDCSMAGFRFVGSGRDIATKRNQVAIFTYKGTRHEFYNLSFKEISGAGILNVGNVGEVNDRQHGSNFSNCEFFYCNIGLAYQGRSEYNNATAIRAYYNNTAILDDSGNNNLCGFTMNYNGTGYKITFGSNNAHGQITGGNFNHHTVRSIDIADAATGMLITGVSFFDAPFLVHDSKLVIFRACLIDSVGGTFDGAACTGCGLEDCSFYSAATDPRTVITGTGGASYYVRNLTVPNGRKYNWLNDYTLETGSFIVESNNFLYGFKLRKSTTEPYVQRYSVPLFSNVVGTTGSIQDSNILLTNTIQNCRFTVTLHIEGLKADGTLGYSGIFIGSFLKTGAATFARMGGLTTVHEQRDLGTESVDMNVTGVAPNDLLRTSFSTGDVGQSYNWSAWVEISMNKV